MRLTRLQGLQSTDRAAQRQAAHAAIELWWGEVSGFDVVADLVRDVDDQIRGGHLDDDVQFELLDLLGQVAASTVATPAATVVVEPLRAALPAILDLLDAEPGPVSVPIEGGSWLRPGSVDPRSRAAEEIVSLGGVCTERTRFIALVRSWVDADKPARECWAQVLINVGDDVSDLLNHPDPAVRVLVAYRTNHPDQVREIRAWLTQTDRQPSDVMGDDQLLARLADRGGRAAAVGLAAGVIARVSNPLSAKTFVGLAFPTPWDETKVLEEDQRVILAAMAERDMFWGTKFADVIDAFRHANLPYDQTRIARLTANQPNRPPST